mgnify:CR=1 FL=1|jgi:hypothetical protein
MFEKGVARYTWKKAVVAIPFPEDAVSCYWCRYVRKDEVGRARCRLTEDILYHPLTSGIGENCPIQEGLDGSEEKHI